MSEHYTATVKITKTEISTPDQSPSGSWSAQEKVKSEGTREVQEVANFVIRADSIESLTEKATAHLQLVED